ncbi:IclR family transcriptional regulator [Mycetocola tolaasinivorans]|uniref:IclR family transcriptional regulator n=1 Tax=Mycetocola tolaasinivorans TaxID=76635 RepID=A0A3L7AAQ9_9MICO|nr:IclR family transcriptional regulator [Mycetocola tolaasinivorans]RLP77287.1 IclR family transcriptional regulator [Mycetocola tolaasinivorans]
MSIDPAAASPADSAPAYAAPAVEKALDILEFLAETPGPVSQQAIAQRTGRSAAQIFRVLSVLERRGYIARDEGSGLYSLSLRLFELAHRHDPIRSLVWLAQPIMRRLAAAVGQSCNLGYRAGDHLVILAESAGPGDFGFRVRVGAEFDLRGTNAGRVLLAFAGAEAAAGDAELVDVELADTLAVIRAAGIAEQPDGLYPGVTDLSAPILSREGVALACLTVPYVATSLSTHPAGFVRDELLAAAAAITELLAGADA